MNSAIPDMPEGFPLTPVDQSGQHLAVGDVVRVLAVESCARGLPQTDQEHLRSIVGERRTIMEIDAYGFVWLSFTSSYPQADFCLFPNEVARS
jgi:hypothetical protein